MKKTDLIHKLKQLEGISDEERAYLINLVNTKKKYGLVWEDKPEDVEEQLRENLPVLKEVKERAIINGEEYPNHILIEGDNLHALTALTFTHEGKIDVIYIDPPYNTGSNDFRYNDDYVIKEDSYRHSKWLSFIFKRLQIAKRLLSDDGIIFISIDDNEYSQLKLVCDEIYGGSNYLSTITVKNKAGAGAKPKALIEVHEYVLMYAKNSSNIKSISVPYSEGASKLFTKKDKHFDVRGPYGTWALGTTSMADRPNLVYPIIHNGEEIWPEKQWLWSRERVEEAQRNDELVFNKMKNGKWSVRFKQYLKDKEGNLRKSTPTTFFDGPYTHEGTKELSEILGSRSFIFPKPMRLIYKLIEFSYNESRKKDQIILDFFAGSGTTLHATMQLNAEDGGNRQCILVTNNENNICEEVTYERNKRVIEGYTNTKGEKVDGLVNNNLRYYKSEFVGREPSIKNKKEITRLATELLCIKEDCYTVSEQDFKGLPDGQDLSAKEVITAYKKYMRLFEGNGNRLLVIYDDAAIEAAVEIIKHLVHLDNPDNRVQTKVYVFSNGQYPYTEEFEEVLPYITLCALPDAIYKAYQNVLPKKVRTRLPDLEDGQDEEKSFEHDVNDAQDKQDKKPRDLFNN